MSKRSPIVAPLVLAAILAVGFGVVWAVVVFWTAEIIDDTIRSQQGRTGASVYIATNGKPLVQYYPSWDLRSVYQTLEGEEVVLPPGERQPPMLDGAFLRAPSGISSSQAASWNGRIVQFTPPLRPARFWYFVHDGRPQGAGYFVAYDRKTKLCAGYFGAKGPSTERPPAEQWLPVDGRLMAEFTAFNGVNGYRGIGIQYTRGVADAEMPPWRSYLISGSRLLEIDFKEESVRTVLESEGIASVNFIERAVDASAPLFPRVPPELRAYLALRMPDRIVVVHPRHAERRTYLLPDELRHRQFQFYELSDQTALVVAHRAFFGEGKYLLFWIDTAGKVVRREEVVDREMTTWSAPTTRAWVFAAAIPSPLAVAALFATAVADVYLWSGEDWGYSQAVGAAFSDAWPALAALVILSAVMTIFVWRRQRRYAATGTLLWMAWVLLGGFPGLFAYRFHRRWPVLAACPACGQRAPRDRDACAHCGTEFPAPAPKGTEVLAT